MRIFPPIISVFLNKYWSNMLLLNAKYHICVKFKLMIPCACSIWIFYWNFRHYEISYVFRFGYRSRKDAWKCFGKLMCETFWKIKKIDFWSFSLNHGLGDVGQNFLFFLPIQSDPKVEDFQKWPDRAILTIVFWKNIIPKLLNDVSRVFMR